ncbi:hypothetical protein [Turneriella parva]|uniref:Uncharacterized protein n=1 Tax=Turneriella parva (strain ATCC BAA-1111 / DSM 21527 / NCTC 11395 / H) TaxID=869212 RepID=I4B4F2_TURPD|nr:hypothetical protein [Turneriella parva]AFM12159.1 hypothetical protein Turpa_1511 [Turneriella parva DSM 21527]
MQSNSISLLALLVLWLSPSIFCAEPGIPENHINGDSIESLPIERLAELKIGKSTLTDVHRLFGLREHLRRTYKKALLPKFYKKKEYSVYRMITYNSYSANRKDFGGIIETTWKESLTVAFFFDRNDVLLLHTTRHRHNDGDSKDHAGKYHDMIGDPAEFWPGAVCDGMFHDIYETSWVKGSDYFGPVETQKCIWLKKLKADVASGVVK